MNDKLRPNTTQIPHFILRQWLPQLTDTELRVVLIICDQTFGWHKDTDYLSYSQLMIKTGASNGSVAIALRSLREKGLIKVLDKKGKQIRTKEEARVAQELYYQINATSPKIGEDVSKKWRPTSPENGDTKETPTKDISNINITNGDKSPVEDKRNVFVNQILKDFSDITGLITPADRQARRVAWNFHQKYGAENFRPALEYLTSLWKKDITKIETVKNHYPTYLRDVKKQSSTKLTKEQEEIAALYASRN